MKEDDGRSIAGQTEVVSKKGLKTPTLPPMVCIGAGLPPLPIKMVERIRANEFVDLAELPPARGKGKLMAQPGEGQIVIVQAADLMQSKRTIPDFATWSQCFGLYVAVLAAAHPGRLADLMSYQSLIARASKKFRWPSWVIYDLNFRQEAAGSPDQQWAKADPSLYAQCFTGQELSRENWCGRCQGLDHSSADCPYQSRKRPWSAGGNTPNTGGGGDRQDHQQPCIKYNKYQGDCRFGRDCRFQHICSKCRGSHPVSRCRMGDSAQK